jgi:hypothetical protein
VSPEPAAIRLRWKYNAKPLIQAHEEQTPGMLIHVGGILFAAYRYCSETESLHLFL